MIASNIEDEILYHTTNNFVYHNGGVNLVRKIKRGLSNPSEVIQSHVDDCLLFTGFTAANPTSDDNVLKETVFNLKRRTLRKEAMELAFTKKAMDNIGAPFPEMAAKILSTKLLIYTKWPYSVKHVDPLSIYVKD